MTPSNHLGLSLALIALVCAVSLAEQPSQQVQAEIRLGLEALQQNDFGAAEVHLSRALAADPSLTEARAKLGFAYYAEHKYAQAAEAYQTALKQKPSLQGGRSFLSLSLAALGRCTEAVPGLEREFTLTQDAKLRRVLGLSLQQCLVAGGALDQAIRVMQQLSAQYPDDPDVLYEAGQMYGRMSSAAYLRLMKVAPHSARANQVMGEVAEADGNWPQAIDAYRKAVRADPNLPGLHFKLAMLMWERSSEPGAWQEALNELDEELKINPNNAPAVYGIASIYRKRGRDDEAIEAFQRALQLDPAFVEARLGLAKALRDRNRREDALTVLKPAEETAPDDPTVHFLLGQLYRDLGRTAEAQQEEATFKRLNAASPRGNQGRGPH